MRTFHDWNEDWQQPLKGVSPRGDAVLAEIQIFWGIKLITNEKLFCIHLVEFQKKKGQNGYYLIAINEHYE
jgi:hypothetical protein